MVKTDRRPTRGLTTGEPAAIPPSFASEVCNNCGYRLNGLPPGSICPECGGTPDPSELILHGWARGRHASFVNARRSRLIISSTIFVVAVCLWLSLFGPSFWIAAWLAVIVVTRIFQFLRRMDSGHPWLIQVRLTTRGCVQFDDLAGPSVVRDLFAAYSWIVLPVVAASVGLAVYRNWLRIDSPPTFAIVVAVGEINAWKAMLRFRRAMRRSSNNAIADINYAYYEFVPWAKLAGYTLSPKKDQTWRLKISRERWVFEDYPVDAEINCTDTQALELKVFIGRCILENRRE